MLRSYGIVAVLSVLSFASGASASQTTSQSDADTKEIAAYRLTMPGLKKVAAITRAVADEMRNDPRFQEIQKLEEEIEALEKKEELSEAEQARIEKLRERKEALEDSAESPLSSSGTLNDMEAGIRKTPALINALKREGMTPREYSKFWLAFLQAAMVHGLQKAGMASKTLPAEINAENVKFIADHEAEIEALQKEFEGLGRLKK